MAATLRMKKIARKYRDLPEEILLEILLYLTAPQLQNLKSVSKLWKFLISQPDFVNTHFLRSQSQSQHHILFETFTSNLRKNHEYHQFSIEANFKPSFKELRLPNFNALSLKASCDGLLLLVDRYYPQNVYISNPLTGYFRRLPHVNFSGSNWILVVQRNKYKVFAVNSETIYNVITLGENSGDSGWMCFRPDGTKNSTQDLLCQPFVLNKEIHWLTTDKDGTDDNVDVAQQPLCYFIYTVHVEALTFVKIKIPLDVLPLCPFKLHAFENRRGLHLLSEVKGSLCLTFVDTRLLRMFVLEDRLNCIWRKTYTVRIQSLTKQPILFSSFLANDICLFTGRNVHGGDFADIVKILIHQDDQLLLYDLKTEDIRPMGFLGKKRKLGRSFFPYSHSLLCPTF